MLFVIMETYAFIVLGLVHMILGYQTGPPTQVCSSMSPNEGHGKSRVGKQPIPYKLLVSNLTYSPGQHIKVILTGEENFQGFFVQARSMNGISAVPIGTFFEPHVGSKTLSCGLSSIVNNAWSHKDNYYKSDIWATWIAPDRDEGSVFFRATVVKSKTHYWENLFSDIITYSGPIISTETTTVKPTTTVMYHDEPDESLGGTRTIKPGNHEGNTCTGNNNLSMAMVNNLLIHVCVFLLMFHKRLIY